MGHRKHRHHLVAGGNVALAVVHVGAEVPVGEHDALRVAGGTGGIVDRGEVIPVVGREDDVVRSEAFRVLRCEELVPMGHGVGDLLVAAQEHVPVVHVEDDLQVGHLLGIHVLPAAGVREEGHAVGMVHQAHHALGLEIRQDGDDDSLVCIDGQIGEAPAGAVVGVEGDLVTFLETGFFENDVETGDGGRHLRIGQTFTADGVERGFVPILAGGGLQSFQIVRIGTHSSLNFSYVMANVTKNPEIFYLCNK